MESGLSESVDFTSLTKEQLIALLQVRGQAIEFHNNADLMLAEKMELGGDLDDVAELFHNYLMTKLNVLAGLLTAQEKIIAGVTSFRPN